MQQNVRSVAKAITDELRFATDIYILSAGENMPSNDGNEYIYIENNQVYYQDAEGTPNLLPVTIDDGTVLDSITFSGEGGSILDFIIDAYKDQQQFQIESSVQPLNLVDPISGVDGGVAIRFKTNDIRMTAHPNEITKGTYTDPNRLSIRLDLINCEIENSIGTGDIVLGDAFAGLNLDYVTENSDTQFVITFAYNTLLNTSGTGSITVQAIVLNIDYDLTATVTVADPVISFINIDGDLEITIPELGGAVYETTYTATVHNQSGYVLPGESVTWDLETPVNGVGIDSSSGQVTVTSDADVGTFTVVATSDGDNTVEGTLDVDLLPAGLNPPNYSVSGTGNHRDVSLTGESGATLTIQNNSSPGVNDTHTFTSSEDEFNLNSVHINSFPLEAMLTKGDRTSEWVVINSDAGNGGSGNGDNESILSAALADIESLDVDNPTNRNNDDPRPTIQLPASVDNIVFAFTGSTSHGQASISITEDGGVVTRVNNSNRTVTITLTGTLNGSSIEKDFDVTIPGNRNAGAVIVVEQNN